MLTFIKPHPFIFNYKSVVIPGIVTFLIISIFAPFGFRELTTGHRLFFGLGLGLLSSLAIVAVVAVARKLLPDWMREDQWTVGKEIVLFLSVVTTICLLIFCCFVFFDLSSGSPRTIFKLVVLYTTLLSAVPITILVLYEQYSFQKQSAKQAMELTKKLNQVKTAPLEAQETIDHVLFEAENGKLELQIAWDKILYLKADGNYVNVFYLNQRNEVQKKLIRNRLKELLETLPASLFFHAHKSYVINGKQIERVEGNARNYELVVHATGDHLPVSRSKSNELTIFLKSL